MLLRSQPLRAKNGTEPPSVCSSSAEIYRTTSQMWSQVVVIGSSDIRMATWRIARWRVYSRLLSVTRCCLCLESRRREIGVSLASRRLVSCCLWRSLDVCLSPRVRTLLRYRWLTAILLVAAVACCRWFRDRRSFSQRQRCGCTVTWSAAVTTHLPSRWRHSDGWSRRR